MALPGAYHFSGSKPYKGYDNEIVGGLELTCAENPHKLGEFYDELRRDGNDFVDFFSRAEESTAGGNQIYWTEDVRQKQRFNATGLVARTGNNFTLNPTAIAQTVKDFNNCSTDKVFFDITKGEKVMVVDIVGKTEQGYVDSVSADRLTATIKSSSGASWTVAGSNLTILPLGRQVPHPDDCGSCFATVYDPKAYTNYFVELDKCYTVNRRDWLSTGSVYNSEKTNGVYRYDQMMDETVKDLWSDIYKTMMFDRVVDDASTVTGYKGMNGVISQIEDRGFTWQGEINSIAHLQDISAQLDYLKAPNKHYVDAEISQYNKLQALPFTEANMNVSYEINSRDREDILKFGITGVNVSGHEFYFRKWGITQGTQFSAKSFRNKYHFLMQPYNYNKIVFSNGKSYNQSHLHIVWGGSSKESMKLLRLSDFGNSTCMEFTVRYLSRFTVALPIAHHWMVGKS